MTPVKTDFLVVGAGIIGLSVALELRSKFSDCSITIIEKEDKPALHASGRNSGVLHAGFYYKTDSIKAAFCREGNKYLTEYCLERRLPINQCGKIVVASNEKDFVGLDLLLKRGQDNDVDIFEIDEKEVKHIDSHVKTFQRAIFSPTTSTVDPILVIESMLKDLMVKKINLLTNTTYLAFKRKIVKTSSGNIEAGYLINTAGLYADKIALDFGFSENYRILPFKGIYLYADDSRLNLSTNVYPVPDLENPFLGVHFTVDVNGKTKIGPTAMPAFWREQYSGIKNFIFSECLEILLREAGLFLFNKFNFRDIAINELKKYSKQKMVNDSKSMVPEMSLDKLGKWGKPGIRAQLVNIIDKRLEMDFIFEGDDTSFHILNAVSPAFTCSKPFAEYAVDSICEKIS